VYCFFDNTDVKLRAPFDAQTLAQKLALPVRVPGTPPAAGRKRTHTGQRTKGVVR
jgi:uncharacterized protein YecE (DUF72 family)